MIDQAGIYMEQGSDIACERLTGINDNMKKSHSHHFFEVYYLENGARFHVIEEDVYALKPGQIAIFAPNVMHRSYGDNNVNFKRIVLYFNECKILSEDVKEKLYKSSGVYTIENKSKYLIREMLDILAKKTYLSYDLKTEYLDSILNFLIVTLLANCTQNTISAKESRMEAIVNYIHNNYSDSPTLNSIAATFFMSPYYLCHEFKKHTKVSLNKYINITKLSYAKRQLIESDQTIIAISNNAGFSNVTHFNRVFKQLENKTPTEYRKIHRQTIL